MAATVDVCQASQSQWRSHLKRAPAKGGFYSEGADTFVISSNSRTLLFS